MYMQLVHVATRSLAIVFILFLLASCRFSDRSLPLAWNGLCRSLQTVNSVTHLIVRGPSHKGMYDNSNNKCSDKSRRLGALRTTRRRQNGQHIQNFNIYIPSF